MSATLSDRGRLRLPSPEVASRLAALAARQPAVRVLAVQGGFDAHARALADLGFAAGLARTADEVGAASHLVLPGGESTTMLKLLAERGLEQALVDFHRSGRPILATCAGLILLARTVSGPAQRSLGLLDVAVERNAYGRQLASFIAPVACPTFGGEPVEAVFIRAPILRSTGPAVEVLARHDTPVLVRQGNILAATFHPELGGDRRVHAAFLLG